MITLATVLAFFIGLFVLWLICKILKISIKIFWKLLINAAAGAVILLLVNLLGGLFGISVAITFLSALMVGVLGVPGVIILLLIQLL